MFELLKADQDGGQGDGHWAEYLRLTFHRTTQPPGEIAVLPGTGHVITPAKVEQTLGFFDRHRQAS